MKSLQEQHFVLTQHPAFDQTLQKELHHVGDVQMQPKDTPRSIVHGRFEVSKAEDMLRPCKTKCL